MRRQSGFALVDLLIVILVIGILVSIAISVFSGQRNKAREAQAKSNFRTALVALRAYYRQRNTYLPVNGSNITTEIGQSEDDLPWQQAPLNSNQVNATAVNSANSSLMYINWTSSGEGVTLCAAGKGENLFCISDFIGSDFIQYGVDLRIRGAPNNAQPNNYRSWPK